MASRKRKQNDTRDININAFKRFFKDSGTNPDGNQSSSTGRNNVIISLD